MLYQRYITDSLMNLTGGTDKHFIKHYIDILYPEREGEEISAQEIVDDIISRAGIIIED